MEVVLVYCRRRFLFRIMSYWNELAAKFGFETSAVRFAPKRVVQKEDKESDQGRGLSRLERDMIVTSGPHPGRVYYKGLVLLAPYFKDKIVMDIGHAEGHILYFMWHHARYVVGCEQSGVSSVYLNFLRKQENTELYNLPFDALPLEIIKKIEVFWICIGNVRAQHIISKIRGCNPTAKIFHFSKQNGGYQLWPMDLGLRIYN